ncbi:MAG: AMP-binding protein [Bacteroidales bacterium]|nr:AMP-binding protein [Bacteroidales bacterium]
MVTEYPHYIASLQESIRRFWDKKALNDVGGESYSFGEMAIRIEKLSLFMSAAGIKPKDDKVAICAHNCARWGMVFLAINTYGSVAVTILFDFTPDSVCNLVDHSESVGLFTTAAKWAKMDVKAMPRLRFAINIEKWDLLHASDDDVKKAFDAMEDAYAAKYPEGLKPADVNYSTDNMDELAIINYTSGSTGNPKGVMLTRRNMSAMIDYCNRWMPIAPDHNMVTMLPMAHMYGLMIEFMYQVCNGCSMYWLGKTPTPAILLKAYADYKPHLLVTVPLVMEKIYKSKIKPVVDKPAMKVLCCIPGIRQVIFKKIRDGLYNAFGGNVTEFIMGGAALNPEVEKWFRKIKFPYTVGYGMTEACPLLAYRPAREYVQGSCGRAIDIVEIRIDSDDPEHVAGEIQARGQSVCIGYYKNEEASATLFTDDGWLRTGDLGTMDADGNVFIRGRSKSMILSANGQNIYPEEVEAVVNNQPGVAESVVVDRAGKLVALVYPDQAILPESGEDQAELAETIRRGANRLLPNYSQLTKVELQKNPFEKTPKMSIKRFLYS